MKCLLRRKLLYLIADALLTLYHSNLNLTELCFLPCRLAQYDFIRSFFAQLLQILFYCLFQSNILHVSAMLLSPFSPLSVAFYSNGPSIFNTARTIFRNPEILMHSSYCISSQSVKVSSKSFRISCTALLRYIQTPHSKCRNRLR